MCEATKPSSYPNQPSQTSPHVRVCPCAREARTPSPAPHCRAQRSSPPNHRTCDPRTHHHPHPHTPHPAHAPHNPPPPNAPHPNHSTATHPTHRSPTAHATTTKEASPHSPPQATQNYPTPNKTPPSHTPDDNTPHALLSCRTAAHLQAHEYPAHSTHSPRRTASNDDACWCCRVLY